MNKKNSAYDPKKIEPKYQKEWLKKKTFAGKDGTTPAKATARQRKKMILVEFPYPSGAGLHMGHMRPFIAGDLVSKYYKLNGYNVMYPIGWDAFGLPAENFAIKNKVHPKVSTNKNIANAKKQLISWGTGYDWSREINTTDPDYYKWTQKIFIEFYKAGLAYEKFGEINWCPNDKTGLANEEVVDGKCERCGAVVEKKSLRQWYLKITDYAEKLLQGLKHLPEWPNAVKVQQENWIGRSEGAEITFQLITKLNNIENKSVTVFTTRVDTLYGVTFLVLAPEHPWVEELLSRLENRDEVEKYIGEAKNKSELDRTADSKDKTGVELKGIKAINPANNEEIPVFIADYVLGGYGTGAIMAVPAHDERDFAFAKKYNLPIKQVVMTVKDDHTKTCKLKEGLEIQKRNSVVCILRNPANDEYAFLKWKNMNWRTPIGGGIEEGETPIEAGRREIMEEVGYKNLKYTGSGFASTLRYHNPVKNINRDEKIDVVFFDLLDEEKNEVAEAEIEKHEIVWIKKGEVEKFLDHDPLNYDATPAVFAWRQFANPEALTASGVLINSAEFDGLTIEDAKKRIVESVGGKIVTKYKLRDWVFSRQRYWGEPIPLIHCPKCGIVPVPDKELPVKLPEVKNYEPTGTGESPLAAIDKWVNVKCPKCIEDNKKTKYLVFDFDGVIGDTFEANLQARIDVGWAKDVEESKRMMYEYFTKKPHHAKGHSYTKEEIAKLQKSFTDFGIATKKHGFKLFESFVKEIKGIKNTKIAIISSGSKVYVHDGAKKSGLKCEAVLTSENSLSKEEKLEFLAKKWKVNIEELYYFTDSTADVYELENLMDKNKIIGCSWGYVGHNELAKALPENQILNKSKDIHNLFKVCDAKRETNTMPQWAGSSWYWLRYMDPKNKKEISSIKNQKYWSPVDLYFGGMEHTTLHLLYSRFWNLFMYDRKLVTVKEPYKKRVPHGIILGPDGEKMSKSRGNVVNPDDVVKLYGADTTRLYMMFLGPHGAQVAWNDKGIIGTRRFLDRVWNAQTFLSKSEPKELTSLLHKTIKKVTEDIESFSFNTAVSSMMIFINQVYEAKVITKSSLLSFITLLSPFAPHIAEEMWKLNGGSKSVFNNKWPKWKESLIKDEKVTIAVSVNGKVRSELMVTSEATDDEVTQMALRDSKVIPHIEGREVKKVIVVKNRLVNIVI